MLGPATLHNAATYRRYSCYSLYLRYRRYLLVPQCKRLEIEKNTR